MSTLLSEASVEERASRFADRNSLFVRGKEFLHFDEPGLADVRVGRKQISKHRAHLRSDPRVELRASTSDWINIRFTTRADAEFVVDWAVRAINPE